MSRWNRAWMSQSLCLPGEFESRPEFDERFELLFEHFLISKDDPDTLEEIGSSPCQEPRARISGKTT
jgi:hypothetical protein